MFIIMFTKTHIVPLEVQELISNRCLYRALTCYKNVEQCYPERTCTKINMPVCMHVCASGYVHVHVCVCDLGTGLHTSCWQWVKRQTGRREGLCAHPQAFSICLKKTTWAKAVNVLPTV